MKKVFALLLSLCLLITPIPVPIHAAEVVGSGECGNGSDSLMWTVTDGGTLTISGTGQMRDYILSYSYAPWMAHKVNITKIVVEEGVTRLGNYAFFDLSHVTSISLPQSVTSIGNGVFKRCIGITEIELPPKLTELGFDAFNQCMALQSITIPDGITEINGGSFEMCTSLTEVHLPEQIQFFGPKAFYSTALQSINIPDTVTHIGEYAFQGCDFSEVTIPDSVVHIGKFAFYDCDSLVSVSIPNGVTKIEDVTFGLCGSLTTIVLPANLESMGNMVFQYCSSLNNIVFPEKSFSIGNDLFWGCLNLFELSFPGEPPEFSENTFQYCTAIARYPSSDSRWTAEVMQNYGGTITWVDDTHTHSMTTTISIPTCDQGGYTTDVCSGCGAVITRDRVNALDHDLSDATCTEPKTCQREGCGFVYGVALGHDWVDLTASPRTCIRCGFLDDHIHNYIINITQPECETGGFTTHTCTACNYTYTDEQQEPLGHDMVEANCDNPIRCLRDGCGYMEGSALGHTWEDPCMTTRTCSICGFSDNGGGHFWEESSDMRYCFTCGKFEGGYLLDLSGMNESVWFGTAEYYSASSGDHRIVLFKNRDVGFMMSYTYNDTPSIDPHNKYPTGMKVWRLTLEGDRYTATRVEELDNILQYAGSSIRITGTKGIRMITSIEKSKKEALTGKGLAGYKLVEYGTALCWAKDVRDEKNMVLEKDFVKSNYAYKKGVADPIFAQTKDVVQYTNVLVGFTLDQCKEDIAMRPYMILEDADGTRFTIYGGIVYRSIGYIAYQNRNVFKPGTSSYDYVWEIIHHVYGDKYDPDYQG